MLLRRARVEDFPVRPDDDELLVEEFEMLELQPELEERLRVTVHAVLRTGEPEVELWLHEPELAAPRGSSYAERGA
jgi:hypothetical protein